MIDGLSFLPRIGLNQSLRLGVCKLDECLYAVRDYVGLMARPLLWMIFGKIKSRSCLIVSLIV